MCTCICKFWQHMNTFYNAYNTEHSNSQMAGIYLFIYLFMI